MAEQLPDTYYRTPFKFNGKELDEETGLYYYGARYYDPKISIWLSVDPLAESFPNWNPYNYTMQNPINLVDPTGMSSEEPEDGDPPKKGLVQRINEGIRSFFNLDVYRDAEDFAASGGKDDQLSRKLSFNSRLIDGKTKALEKTLEVIVMAHPLGEEAEALAYLMSGNSDAFAQKLQIDGGYYVAGLLLPVVNAKQINAGFKVISMNQLNKLVKTGKAPKTITRFDLGKVKGEINHVHFDDGSALNIDGTWKHGNKSLTNKEVKFLQENGWTIPE